MRLPQPARIIFLIILGIVGLIGVNMFILGPLDKRNDQGAETPRSDLKRETDRRVERIFEDVLREKGVKYEKQEDGLYSIELSGHQVSVNLESLSKDYFHYQNPNTINAFVEKLLSIRIPLPEWTELESRIRISLEPSDYDFEGFIVRPFSGNDKMVLIYVDPQETLSRWITKKESASWDKTEQDLFAIAYNNLAEILSGVNIEKFPIDDSFVARFPIEIVSKPALLIAPNLKEKVSQEMGWPFLAVMPAQEVFLLLPEGNDTLLRKTGAMVLRYYNEAPHPLSTEIFRVSDEGVKAIGSFKPNK
jgi:hypothetical protein